MKPQVKIGIYVLAVACTVIFGSIFARNLRQADAAGPSAPAPGVARAKAAKPPKATTAGTNAPAPSTNETASGEVATNDVATAAADPASNNEPPAVPPSELTPEQEPVPASRTAAVSRSFGKLVVWGLLTVIGMVCVGVLIAYDVSRYAAKRASDVMFDDGGGIDENAYEAIEKVYGAGDYLEAVRLLRDYLKSDPRAVHAQLRIAEIYEKDLRNPLASALEYEEVLKLPLEPVRRGWTAIHLVNLYNHLEKPEQGIALLRRIVLECPDTPAAAKARDRLTTLGEAFDEPPPSAAEDTGGLPPGFKPKR